MPLLNGAETMVIRGDSYKYASPTGFALKTILARGRDSWGQNDRMAQNWIPFIPFILSKTDED
jgi:hypothetical protein